MIGPEVAIAALLTLAFYLYAAFTAGSLGRLGERWPVGLRLGAPGLLCIPYALVASSAEIFRWEWLTLYAVLPIAVAALLWQAGRVDVAGQGSWRDFLVLIVLGLAVDLRWFEAAWPARLAVFNKMLLLDAGIYGFLVMRKLDGVGFDLRVRWRDAKVGLREWIYFVPIAVPLGLWLGFLHLHGFHASWMGLLKLAAGAAFTFFFIAVPEELFFRGWLQNLLERRVGRSGALVLTSVLFGLSHFNKRALHFNGRYVLLATVAGIFYGRAWREERRVEASAVAHTLVDTVWSFWLR